MIFKSKKNISFEMIIFVIGFLMIAFRLFYLQVINYDILKERSESNFIGERIIKHKRGKIIDSQGRVLADNRIAYDLYVTFALLPDISKILKTVASDLPLSFSMRNHIKGEIKGAIEANFPLEIQVASNLTFLQCSKLEQKIAANLISGFEIIYFSNANSEKMCQVNIKALEFLSGELILKNLLELFPAYEEKLLLAWKNAQKKAFGLNRFKPILLLEDIGFDAFSLVQNNISLGALNGVNISYSTRRRYIYGDFAVHAIGFVNQTTLDEVKQYNGLYRVGDFIGRRGVEASYENDLRGKDGLKKVIVDAKGRELTDLFDFSALNDENTLPPQEGATLELALDFSLQNAAQKYFLGKSGSIVALDVHTGEVKALASFPSYDANKIVSGSNASYINSLLSNEFRPMRNKAVQDHYMPGSTFKIITAISGIANKHISHHSEKYCSGHFSIKNINWRCFKRSGHGHIDLATAVKESCDGYFYDLSNSLGLELLSNTASSFGFGKKTGIDIIGESSGILPSVEYYKKRFGYVAPGFVVNMGIGQGDITVTPLQLAVAYAIVANGGKIVKPRLVNSVDYQDAREKKVFTHDNSQALSSSDVNFNFLLNSLSKVTESGGTAFSVRYRPENKDIADWIKLDNKKIVGKTGTAQVVKLAKHIAHIDPENVPYKERDHAWFVGIYPKEDPQIVIVVMAEHEGFGGSISAPSALRMMMSIDEANNDLNASYKSVAR